MNKNEVTPIILAGGEGKRLRAITSTQKVIAKINNRPFIIYLLDLLESAGFIQTIICIGYRSNDVIAKLGNAYGRMELIYSFEKKALGTAGAIVNSLSKSSNDHLLILNGDSFCDINLGDFLDFYTKKNNLPSLVTMHLSDTARFGRIEFDREFRITSFIEKNGKRTEGWINSGIYLLPRAVFRNSPKDEALSMEYQVLPDLIRTGLFAYTHNGKFVDIGTPESFHIATIILKDEQKP
jgi:D-glycero-alpha-D-manno-heptose 1-phosphate guanylyltransferase